MRNSSTMEDFSNKLRQAIDESGLTLRAAAAKIGMDHGNLSRILSGKEGVTLERAEHIAKKLGFRICLELEKISKIGAA